MLNNDPTQGQSYSMSEEDRITREKRLGPHEGQELELMLAGKKPLALFYDTIPECGVIPEREFAPHVNSGKLVMSERTFQSSEKGKPEITIPVRVVFYALPEEAGRIDQGFGLMEEVLFQPSRPNDDDDARLGRLLGYTEEEIKQHLA